MVRSYRLDGTTYQSKYKHIFWRQQKGGCWIVQVDLKQHGGRHSKHTGAVKCLVSVLGVSGPGQLPLRAWACPRPKPKKSPVRGLTWKKQKGGFVSSIAGVGLGRVEPDPGKAVALLEAVLRRPAAARSRLGQTQRALQEGTSNYGVKYGPGKAPQMTPVKVRLRASKLQKWAERKRDKHYPPDVKASRIHADKSASMYAGESCTEYFSLLWKFAPSKNKWLKCYGLMKKKWGRHPLAVSERAKLMHALLQKFAKCQAADPVPVSYGRHSNRFREREQGVWAPLKRYGIIVKPRRLLKRPAARVQQPVAKNDIIEKPRRLLKRPAAGAQQPVAKSQKLLHFRQAHLDDSDDPDVQAELGWLLVTSPRKVSKSQKKLEDLIQTWDKVVASTSKLKWKGADCVVFQKAFQAFRRNTAKSVLFSPGYMTDWMARGHFLNRLWHASAAQWPSVPLGRIGLWEFTHMCPDSHDHLPRLVRHIQNEHPCVTTAAHFLQRAGLNQGYG